MRITFKNFNVSFVGDEINVEDFDKWYQLIEIHAQMTGSDAGKAAEIKDNLCMLALKNSLAENTNKFKEDSVNYNFHPKNNEFLLSVRSARRYGTYWTQLNSTHSFITDFTIDQQNERQM